MKKGLPRGQFFASDKTENHTNEGKRKEKDRKRIYIYIYIVIYILTMLEMVFEKRKLLDGRGLFSSNVFTNPARNSSINIPTSLRVC